MTVMLLLLLRLRRQKKQPASNFLRKPFHDRENSSISFDIQEFSAMSCSLNEKFHVTIKMVAHAKHVTENKQN